MNKKVIIILIVIIALALLAFLFYSIFLPKEEPLPVLNEAPVFRLQTNTGEEYNSDNGKIKLLTFIYTKCPSECPMTMVEFTDLQEVLKEKEWFGTDVELIAISFDENDTVEDLANYGELFGQDPTGWHILYGEPEEIEVLTKDLFYLVQRADENFFIHSLTMYLIDDQNNIRSLPKMASKSEGKDDLPIDKEQIMADIAKLVDEKKRR